MKKPTVYLTRPLPEPWMSRLEAAARLEANHDDRPVSREALLEGVLDKDGLLCFGGDTIGADVLKANPNLKVISNFGVGYNNIDIDEATRLKIPVTNTPGVLTDATADLAWALLFAVARRVVEGDTTVRSGRWEGPGPMHFLGTEVTGSTLGLIGLGRIGKAMVARARGFRMTVLYWNRTRLPAEAERSLGIHYAPMDEVLQRSRFISLHVALTDETRHLIGPRELSRIGADSFLINTTRGAVVDEAALAEALRAGTIAGAGLDVYENEPVVHPGLVDLKNVVLLPHLGSATTHTRKKMAELAVTNCLSGSSGRRPAHLVNPEVFN